MNPTFSEESTTIPLDDGQSVTIEPGQPWPSAYRGSQYSLVSDDNFSDAVLKWETKDLQIYTDPPESLRRSLVLLGKSGGYGSFRVTAENEILTKVEADDYANVDQAVVDSGWIPAYVGKLEGAIDFDEVDLNPPTPSRGSVAVWRGFPFKHGERWSVSTDGKLVWKWRDYRFESAFEHSELVAEYQKYRPNAGRCYLTENGHVWINVPSNDVQQGKASAIKRAISKWKREAEEAGDTATLRLVNRRLVATSRDDDPSNGFIPVHIGHLRDFDDGVVPRAVVDEPAYFKAVSEYEQVWE